MSIVTLKKVSIFGLIAEKQKVLKKLQTMGNMHLIALDKQLAVQEPINSEKCREICKALKHLQSCKKKRHQVIDDDTFNLSQCVEQILLNKKRWIDAEDQYKSVKYHLANVKPWGDFKFPKMDDIGGYRFWFYKIPVGKIKNISTTTLVLQIVYQDFRYAYVIVISRDEPPVEAMPTPRVHVGSQSLSQLNKQLNNIEIVIEDLAAERESLTRWILMLNKYLVESENTAALTRATSQTLDKKNVFIVQGWIPDCDVDGLSSFVNNQQLAMMTENPTANEMPPTLLANPKLVRGAEKLVNFYQTPGYHSCDPSLVLFFSFTLFFAMILGDAGYAFLIGLGLLLFWRPLGKTEQRRSMRNLAIALMLTSIAWGALMGNYFGLSPVAGSFLSSIQVFDIKDTRTMMTLSIYIGVFHLLLANACKAWHYKDKKRALVPLGWIAVIIGGFILMSSQWDGGVALDLKALGWTIFGIGLFFVFLFSSERRIRQPIDLLWRILDGIKELTKLTKVFGDLLSYLRLFALGLAGSSLAFIFNHNAAHAIREQTGMNILNCILIWTSGHTLNLLLCVMSGVVHGLRLNFIEYFAWSVSEEGYPFNPLLKKEIQE